MKNNLKYLFIAVLVLIVTNTFAQVGIGTDTPAASAALEVSSSTNNKGILIPRVTATQKDAISNPAEGLMVYQTSAPAGFYFYTGTAWKLMVTQTDIDLKVTKVTGKDLSSNDYTSVEKTKLSAITGTNTGDQDLSALATIASVALKANATDVSTSLASKVDKVTGKDLSSNDYTSAEKTKVSNLSGTNTGDQDLSALATAASVALKANTTAVTTSLASKVDKVPGKGLTSNDYTSAEKSKLSAIIGANTGDQDLSALATIASVALKANTTDVNTSLALKANTAEVTNSLALKANTTDVNTNLATKVDKVTGKDLSSNDYTSAEKTKLAAITGTNTGDQTTITGNAGTATKLAAPININGVAFDGSSAITVTAHANTLSGTVINPTVTGSSLTSVGTLANLTVTTPIAGSVTGTASNVTGIVAIANGGTNSTATPTAGGIGYGNGTALGYTAAGTAGQVLRSNGADVPTWITPSSVAVPYTGATQAVDLGAYNLTVNGVSVGRGSGAISSNTAIGARALSKNTTGSNNTANGVLALVNNTTGSNNSAQGIYALEMNTTGSNNTSNGMYALLSNTTGSYNTAIGNHANVATGALTNATAIGASATVNASNTIQLGNTNVENVKTSGTITAGAITYPNAHGTIGQVLTSTGSGTLTWTSAIGSEVTSKTATISDPFDFVSTPYLSSSLNVTTADNFSNGKNVLAANTSGIANVGIGINVLTSNTTGSANTSVGFNALKSNETGRVNSAFGSYALYNNTTGEYNTAIGGSALISNTTGSNNSAFGEWALLNNSTGTRNTASGTNALKDNTEGSYNTGIGRQSLNHNTTGSYNTGIGRNSLTGNLTGNHNTAIGNKAGVAYSNLENTTAIGDSAIVSASNTIQLGNTAVTNVITSGKITADAVTYPNTDGTAGQALLTNGAGVLSWGSAGSAVREVADEFTATASQTSFFPLTQTPSANSKVKMFVNGIRISNTAYNFNLTTVTYIPANNGGYALSSGDRIQFDYYY